MLHIIIHPQKSKLLVLPIKDNAKEPSFQGTLILKYTPKGARVGKFRGYGRAKRKTSGRLRNS